MSGMTRVLVIDNYDSFVYTLNGYLRQLGAETEVVRNDVAWRNDIVTRPLQIERGIAHAPTEPGLGIEINEKEAAKHPFAPEVTMPYFHRDGSVADW